MRSYITILLLGWPLLAACSSSEPLPTADFGPALDAFGEEGAVLDLVEGLPASFLVGDAIEIENLLAIRSSLAQQSETTNTLIQCAELNELSFTGLADEVLEAALEDGGPILLDRVGTTAASLRQGLHGVLLVTVDDEGAIVSAKEM
ncbi:MAG: hypothetical protein QM477_03530 [Planctomycetota bacterium]